ncbi:MAG: MBL fold metallo-hydrolase [Gammaproteobacteria bacterium]|nr:MBL fold metallo-hydrolase [Gammaproteobacteria bacterium]
MIIFAGAASALDERYCGDKSVWLQILGSGSGELDDDRGAASYLVWLDDKARLLVDPGPGSSVRFGEAGAKFDDLDAIVFSHLHTNHTADFPSFIAGSEQAGRDRPLPVIGPDGDGETPSTVEFVERMIGPDGAYGYLASYLTFRSAGGYKVSARNVPATGRRRWSRFGTRNLRLSAMPVHHGTIPTIAWRVEIGGFVLLFAGDFSNQRNIITDFAKDADVLVIHHSIPEAARGAVREEFVVPSQIGRIAAASGVRMLVLGHRGSRTLGRESISRTALEQYYTGPVIFANELECWGL